MLSILFTCVIYTSQIYCVRRSTYVKWHCQYLKPYFLGPIRLLGLSPNFLAGQAWLMGKKGGIDPRPTHFLTQVYAPGPKYPKMLCWLFSIQQKLSNFLLEKVWEKGLKCLKGFHRAPTSQRFVDSESSPSPVSLELSPSFTGHDSSPSPRTGVPSSGFPAIQNGFSTGLIKSA